MKWNRPSNWYCLRSVWRRTQTPMLAGEVINPRGCILLGKDTNTFRDTVQGFLEGSDELRPSPAKNGEVKTKLQEVRTLFKEFGVGCEHLRAICRIW